MTNGQINHLNDPEKIMNEITIMKSVRHVSKLRTLLVCSYHNLSRIHTVYLLTKELMFICFRINCCILVF